MLIKRFPRSGFKNRFVAKVDEVAARKSSAAAEDIFETTSKRLCLSLVTVIPVFDEILKSTVA